MSAKVVSYVFHTTKCTLFTSQGVCIPIVVGIKKPAMRRVDKVVRSVSLRVEGRVLLFGYDGG